MLGQKWWITGGKKVPKIVNHRREKKLGVWGVGLWGALGAKSYVRWGGWDLSQTVPPPRPLAQGLASSPLVSPPGALGSEKRWQCPIPSFDCPGCNPFGSHLDLLIPHAKHIRPVWGFEMDSTKSKRISRGAIRKSMNFFSPRNRTIPNERDTAIC